MRSLIFYSRDTSRESWYRAAAKEILAYHKKNLGEYTTAADLFVELATSANITDERRARMYHQLVAVRLAGLKNYQSAFSTYLTLRSLFPSAPEVTYSKVILRLPLVQEDFVRVRNINNHSIPIVASPRDESEVWSESYPNPFNLAAVIRFNLPARSIVSLNVYSALGKRVATLVHDLRNKGVHEVRFDASPLPSGVYRYELRVMDEDTYEVTTMYGNMLMAK